MGNRLFPDVRKIRDWREPQIIPANGLTDLLAEAALAGFKVRVFELWKKPFGYRVKFWQQSNECPWRCH